MSSRNTGISRIALAASQWLAKPKRARTASKRNIEHEIISIAAKAHQAVVEVFLGKGGMKLSEHPEVNGEFKGQSNRAKFYARAKSRLAVGYIISKLQTEFGSSFDKVHLKAFAVFPIYIIKGGPECDG